MTIEKSAEYQYNRPLGSIATLFNCGMAAGGVHPGNYPTSAKYDSPIQRDWMVFQNATVEVNDLLILLKKIHGKYKDIEIFHEIARMIKEEPKYQGKTSHILFGMLNFSWIGDGKFLAQEIMDKDSGQPLNPTFKQDQPEIQLPENLQIRKTIMDAIFSDLSYQLGVADGTKVVKFNEELPFRDLARQRSSWYEALYRMMLDKTEVKPAEQPLI